MPGGPAVLQWWVRLSNLAQSISGMTIWNFSSSSGDTLRTNPSSPSTNRIVPRSWLERISLQNASNRCASRTSVTVIGTKVSSQFSTRSCSLSSYRTSLRSTSSSGVSSSYSFSRLAACSRVSTKVCASKVGISSSTPAS